VTRVVVAAAFWLVACAPDQNGADSDGGGNHGPDAAPGDVPDGTPGFIDGSPNVPDASSDGGSEQSCNVLPARIRDFHVAHPDFEHFTTDAISPGIVANDLGPDGTPVWASPGTPACTTGAPEFAQWYHDVAGVNQAIPIELTLTKTANGYVYDNGQYFPIDNAGFGNEGFAHNFAFTTEIHTSFKYNGGETFTFRGDDDLWLFINGKLAIDLGGLHQPQQQTLMLDAKAAALGLHVGGTYHMDIFGAERHSTASNFRIETTIECLIVM
jgi:fibro-slime domain-containing protein